MDLEDSYLEKHIKFFDLLEKDKKKYNLRENEFNLMKGVFFCNFNNDDKEKDLMSFSILYYLSSENGYDNIYYQAKIMCICWRYYLKLDNIMSEEEIDKFYKEVENKKLFDFYSDYGDYLLNKNNKSNLKIIEIFTTAVDKKGDLFSNFRAYQSLINYYDFYELMGDYDNISKILDFLLNEIVFERLSLTQFVILMGYLFKYCKFKEKIISNYLIYVKEINDYISINLIKTEKGEKINEDDKNDEDDDNIYAIKGNMYYFGFEGIEEKNLQKAIEFFDKACNITQSNYNKKIFKFIKFKVIKEMHSLKLISDDELIKEKKELIQFYMSCLNIENRISDCYIIGEDYYNGIVLKKDEALSKLLFETAEKRFCKIVVDWKIKSEIKQFLKNNKYNAENIFNDDICGMCYEQIVENIFIPCKHKLCSFCAELLKNEKKCPFCRTKIFGII